MPSTPELTNKTVDLLQHMIRNECVNEGTEESGQEVRNADLLEAYIAGAGLDVERYDAAPGRTSIVARIEGSDPNAPSLCLNGHTDVVPVNRDGWDRDPFGGELIDGEVWGRGAIDMLGLTSAMAVVFRHLADTNFRPKGDLIFFGVADEESGSKYGAQWMADNHPDAIRSDYVLTENGGLHGGSENRPTVTMNVGEKGVAWRRLRVKGTPGHGSRPYGADNALIKAAAIVQRVAEYKTPPRFHELWRSQIEDLGKNHGLENDLVDMLLDPKSVDEAIASMPLGIGGHLHSCCHMTLSPNVLVSPTKTNTIPDVVDIDIDVRTMPGETPQDVQNFITDAIGPELAAEVEFTPLMNDMSSMSPIATPLWDSLQKAVSNAFPTTEMSPGIIVGFTDARVHRNLGAVAYGAGLLSPDLSPAEYGSRFHGHNERIDVESIGLTTGLYLDTVTDLLG
ncbi:M20/M25/M40 family metallo-hydrolase [Acidimicrobiales bacterium]|nr:M20/M25/M40 family metallo-hydrolase [Acidimicrobiaceae bacterium]MDB9845193.1 M20/M25/M40 family metallo-hydrolase [Acidimicrobiales bacterium]